MPGKSAILESNRKSADHQTRPAGNADLSSQAAGFDPELTIVYKTAQSAENTDRLPMRHRTITAVCLLGFCTFWTAVVRAAPAGSASLVSGTELVEQLAAPVSVSWSNLPLLRALKSLGAAQHLAIVLDRRVDPGRPISLVLAEEPLGNALEKIARHLQIGYCQLGSIAYFGPPAMAERLRTLAALRLEDIRPLPAAMSRKFLLARSWHWDDLAEPRKLVAELAEEAGVELSGVDKIPHDLWPAADWPLLTWIDRLTLVAAQFDLTFRLDKTGNRVELIPLPDKAVLSRTYEVPRDAAAVARRWAKEVPGARVTVEKNKIRLAGRLEDHELVEQRLRGTPSQRATVTAGKEVYQLSVENAALSQVVDQLAGRLNLKFDWNRAAIDVAGISVDQLVSVKVQNAPLDELLRAVFAGTGLTFKRADRAISIYPATGR